MCTIIIVHNTVTQIQFLFIFPFLQTNITSQMWPTGGKGVRGEGNPPVSAQYKGEVKNVTKISNSTVKMEDTEALNEPKLDPVNLRKE